MQGVDIRPLKERLRKEIKLWRRSLSDEQRADADAKIAARLFALREYRECRAVLTYVSQPIEVDTRAIIARALADGKRVAAPRCVEGTREMEFYYIDGIDDLAPQTFGVLEPLPDRCEVVTDFSGSICVIPALAYDKAGYRLGYGAGYYDRFLSLYSEPKIGVIYAHNLRKKLWHGRFDVAANLVVTETRLHVCFTVPYRRSK